MIDYKTKLVLIIASMTLLTFFLSGGLVWTYLIGAILIIDLLQGFILLLYKLSDCQISLFRDLWNSFDLEGGEAEDFQEEMDSNLLWGCAVSTATVLILGVAYLIVFAHPEWGFPSVWSMDPLHNLGGRFLDALIAGCVSFALSVIYDMSKGTLMINDVLRDLVNSNRFQNHV